MFYFTHQSDILSARQLSEQLAHVDVAGATSTCVTLFGVDTLRISMTGRAVTVFVGAFVDHCIIIQLQLNSIDHGNKPNLHRRPGLLRVSLLTSTKPARHRQR